MDFRGELAHEVYSSIVWWVDKDRFVLYSVQVEMNWENKTSDWHLFGRKKGTSGVRILKQWIFLNEGHDK